jgi:DNA-binding response OmpR family regulator
MAKSIIVVEDDPLILDAITMNLESSGYTVRSALNGVEALELMEGQLPDLVITDITMSTMNGFELCKRIKHSKEFQSVPIFMLTARSKDEDKFFNDYEHPEEYLTKPIDMTILLDKVRNHIGS